jgi:hypothetical protein
MGVTNYFLLSQLQHAILEGCLTVKLIFDDDVLLIYYTSSVEFATTVTVTVTNLKTPKIRTRKKKARKFGKKFKPMTIDDGRRRLLNFSEAMAMRSTLTIKTLEIYMSKSWAILISKTS